MKILLAKSLFSFITFAASCAFAAALNAETLDETCYGNPRFELNMQERACKNALDYAVKSAITQKIGDFRKERYGKTSSVQTKSLNAKNAHFIVMRNKRPVAEILVRVNGTELISNNGAFPRTEKNVKFNLKGTHRSYPGENVYGEAAYEFIKRNEKYFDCRGRHEHGEGSGTRRYCRDVVNTVRKIAEIDLTLEVSEIEE